MTKVYYEVKSRNIAAKYHEGQKYGNDEYWKHLSDVVISLQRVTEDQELLAIGRLHDLLEDTPCTVDELYEIGMTERIVKGVLDISKVEGESYNEYIAKVKSNPDSLIVKKHDTLCNLTQSLMEGNSKRIKKYAKQLLLLEE